jgi:hypothetical protein
VGMDGLEAFECPGAEQDRIALAVAALWTSTLRIS